MNLNSLTSKAKDLFNKRGGSAALKEDAQELKDIAGRKGSASDKAKAAFEAVKDPGAPGADKPRQPDAPSNPAPGGTEPREPGA